MSLLDNDLDLDINWVAAKLFIQDKYVTENIILMDGFYWYDINTKQFIKIEYDNNPNNWLLAYRFKDDKCIFYITKYKHKLARYEYSVTLGVGVGILTVSGYNLKTILDEYAR